MAKKHTNGKGDKRRPGDNDSFRDNWDRIFGVNGLKRFEDDLAAVMAVDDETVYREAQAIADAIDMQTIVDTLRSEEHE